MRLVMAPLLQSIAEARRSTEAEVVDPYDDQHSTSPKLRRLLTPDERQVCEIIRAGAASPLEIATSLHLTLLEVEALMESASEKLDASFEMDEAASSHISDATH